MTTTATKPTRKPAKPKATDSTAIRRTCAMMKHASDPTRLQILLRLADGETHVGAICEGISQSQPAVSHHLALLRHSGVVETRRAGKNSFYSLTEAGREIEKAARGMMS